MTERSTDRMILAQGVYYLGTGIWPLVHRRSFEAVTGPKSDFWLAQTVGALVACVGATLVLAQQRGRVGEELRLLAASSAVSLGAVDAFFAVRGRISKMYLLDALIQTPFSLGALFVDRGQ